MSTLSTNLRRQLESAVKQARKIAADGARHALEALAVHEPKPYDHMKDEAQRGLRNKLRAQAKQLGDGESQTRRGACEIKHLSEKLAYDQWHRLLFARYLLENNLLISPEHGVSVTLDDCEELAMSLSLKDAWAVAARFAAKELPEIFRADDPAGAVELSVNDRQPLIGLVTALPVEVFTASDSLGWCYQFWQAEKKDEVNSAGNKIGADELPAVTQLFTEDYMVDFLLDNTFGAWYAGKSLVANPNLAVGVQEDELRQAVALPGCPWKYLRFIKDKDGHWIPGAGTFDSWPKTAKELKCLDPCMGSGHFVVAMFERLVALRLAEETLDEAKAVAAVIRDNLFGLEIDPRCTQIGAFNLALAAWRRVGYCKLPAMNLACSGLAPNAKLDDWVKLAGENEQLRNGMDRLYQLFKDAPVLGSLINPLAAEGTLLVAAFHELQPLLEKALSQETKDDTAHEMAVTARGLAKATEILADQFTLVATNVPYLATRKQCSELLAHLESHFYEARFDLATALVARCLVFAGNNGSVALVTPQTWQFLGSYKAFRVDLVQKRSWQLLVRLGPNAFETIGGEVVNVALVVISGRRPVSGNAFHAYDVSAGATCREKENLLLGCELLPVGQHGQLKNPDAVILFDEMSHGKLLSDHAQALAGILNGDAPRFRFQFWEVRELGVTKWTFLQENTARTELYGGRSAVLLWESGGGQLRAFAREVQERLHDADKRGNEAWGHWGVAVSRMGRICATLYSGEHFDQNVAVVLPSKQKELLAIWMFCESAIFPDAVRKVNPNLAVSSATVAKIPFDLAHWQKVASEKYPNGLPKPYSSDPTQWLFNGNPTGADQPLHVAVARLLGYQWPRQTGSSFPDCPALGPDGLEKLSDDDGIVPISPAKGEGPGAERLRELLARAYGKDWNATRQEELLAQVDYAGASLEDWLRNGFFEQHCALFQHRPFIWHIWDGLKNGFSVMVNYHKLTHANLEKLTFAYLGDWIRDQQAAVAKEVSGSDAKLQAAKQLQDRLKLILEGELPYDIFVRWKSLLQQPIGWHPDLNDGVRMNIRPFATADILRKRVKIKWEKDRGKEPVRDKKEFPWFWSWDEERQDFSGGSEFDGNRWNDCHYTNEFKQRARKS